MQFFDYVRERIKDHDDVPPRGNYSKFTVDETLHTERQINKLSQGEDGDVPYRRIYGDFR